MNRALSLLGLIAALAGTPLRLAEAADDLARAAEGRAGDIDVEQADGGVGDDSGASIKAASTHVPEPSDLTSGAPAFLPPFQSLSAQAVREAMTPPHRPPHGLARRLASLQTFLC